MAESHKDKGRYPGLDFDDDRKMLIAADSLAWCCECGASPMGANRRYAETTESRRADIVGRREKPPMDSGWLPTVR